jgi:DNA-binding NtrC family response regulator
VVASARRAAVVLLALLAWPALRSSAQTVTVDAIGEALKIRAPGFGFLKGDPLARLKDGRSVRVELAAMVLPAPGKPPAATTRRIFALSYDLWEDRFAVTTVDAHSQSVSHLMMAAAEAWCVEQLAIPVSALGGAAALRRGKFELADGGTIFLDEVGDLHEASQAKLLRVLQDGELQRVGGEQAIKVATRVVSATNRRLNELVSDGRFREDLYYRLNVVPIPVPALRERMQDIVELVPYFLSEFCARNNFRPRTIEPDAVEGLERYSWPGNIRELRNVVERMAILTPGDRITADAIPLEVRSVHALRAATGLQEVRDSAERERIRQALDQTDWNVSAAARLLDTERTALHKRIRSLGLKR